ncbi:sodium channel protein Nach-like [Galleria mellonella]|uniref:Sodium channel protein Nach-like n=1 Tax=Galleria mellonella TaxID=7137 RepID=A0ABM3MYX6_GALME|nr:sodium channel protein Nach-like [Galleria mellonella]
MEGNFRNLFRKFCLEGSFIGLKYFYIYPDFVSRCFWMVNTVLTLGLSWTLVYLLYNRFNDRPTRITIENQYEMMKNMPYPSITICSPNQITISSMKHFNKTLVDGDITFDLERVLPQLLGFYVPLQVWDAPGLEQLQKVINLNRYTVPEVINLMPQRCDRFLKLCILQRKSYPHCRGLFRPILTTNGHCCIFNNIYYFENKRRNEKDFNFLNWKVKSFGPMEPLTVVTDYEPDDALDGTIVNAGSIRIMINDMYEFPADEETKLVHPYTESFHIIHVSYTYCSEDVRALPSSSRNCFFNDEQHLPFFGDYRNSDCDQLCYVKAVEAACDCMLYYVPYVKAQRACNFTSISCIVKAKLHIFKWLTSENCDCPRDCDSRRYTTDMTVGNLDALPYVMTNSFTDLKLNKSSSIMHFYFPNPVYVKQKQETVMSLISITSNLGGVFGLCLGCSSISILEILFYIYKTIKNSISRKSKQLQLEREVFYYN